ncbi:hypothetical protein SAMN04488542_12556 [Fontibacillus panacisegetis]|uniref:Uncharacterized protein n=1 Tax=Fontibacillus panacisegetis TaxID=670482 RepID=A0A1G7RAT5_9BACL|nr:hypothetical protein SAMN04488542_12556 [Fontibacillus panacisegetis]
MNIINPFGKTVNNLQPRAGCTCSTIDAKSQADSTFVCLGNCGCSCGCTGSSSKSDNQSANYTNGSNKHMF